MGNFEAFCWNISSSIKILFLKSDIWVKIIILTYHLFNFAYALQSTKKYDNKLGIKCVLNGCKSGSGDYTIKRPSEAVEAARGHVRSSTCITSSRSLELDEEEHVRVRETSKTFRTATNSS